MIVANLATYPARIETLPKVVAAIAPQVDQLNIVLNEYEAELPELTAFQTVRQILPPHDTKDTGKFFPNVTGAEYVFTLDDDILFPPDFVEVTLDKMRALGPGHIGGYHASLYEKPPFSLKGRRFKRWIGYRKKRIVDYRRVFTFYKEVKSEIVVDQVASGTAVMAARDFPPYAYMKDSHKFVDVRLARWCFEHDITPVVLPRPANWLKPLRYEETIYRDFTKSNPRHVANEILTYAFKVPNRGSAPIALRRTGTES